MCGRRADAYFYVIRSNHDIPEVRVVDANVT